MRISKGILPETHIIPRFFCFLTSPTRQSAEKPKKKKQASLDIAADSMGLGWTVKASVERLGFEFC